MSTAQGSTGNVIAAICSFFIPGVGQLVQGRILAALTHFVLFGLLWIVWMGWIMHIWSTIDAARWKPPGRRHHHDIKRALSSSAGVARLLS